MQPQCYSEASGYTTEQQTLVNFTWRMRVETPGLEDTLGRIGCKGAGNCLQSCKESSSSSAQSYTVSKTGSVQMEKQSQS